VEYWCFVPTAVDLLPEPVPGGQNPRVIYYCVDDWSKFSNLDTAWVAAKERQMLQRADVIFTPAQYLAGKHATAAGKPIHHIPHGVEHAKFRRAAIGSLPLPDDMKNISGPIIGFYGNIYPWIDFSLVSAMARERPNWTFVIIGQEYCDVTALKALPNVRFIGRREHDELPSYCGIFNAAMIPYDLADPRMTSVNPVKLKELLAAGVPVVTCALPEVVEELASPAAAPFRSNIKIAHDENEWLTYLEEQIHRTDRREISESVAGEDWSAKVAMIRRMVLAATRPAVSERAGCSCACPHAQGAITDERCGR